MSNRFNTRIGTVLAAATLATMTGHGALAAPGTLPPAPLFLSTIVEPNVFVTLDDSGSMDWGPMVKEGIGEVRDASGDLIIPGITTDNGLPYIDGLRRGYYSPGVPRLYSSRYNLPPADGTDLEWDKAWIIRNHFGNANYYNPSVEYKPWPGTLANGDPMYPSITDPTKTPIDPDDFNPTDSSTYIDLTARHTFSEGTKTSTVYIPTYFIWDDDIKIPYFPNGTLDNKKGDLKDVNRDGIIDSADGDPVIPNGVIELDDGRRRVEITDPAELRNFANWYAYYRSRINVTKSVLGSVINQTDAARMGIRLFNEASNLADISTMTDPANKRTMLDRLYEKNIRQAGTPARQALFDTGAYFAQTGVNAPILPVAGGGECQQNFNITVSDGFWNSFGFPDVGNTDANNSDLPNVGAPFDVAANVKAGFDGGSYADSHSNTLADVSMMLYETDLRPDLADKVPTLTDVDEASHQHLVGFTVAFGIEGTLDPDVKPTDPTFTGWPEPVRNTETTVDDMWHAAYNGRGEFLNAQNPAELEASLTSAITTISERTGTAAAVAVNSAQLSLESVIYLAQFNSNRWQGNLLAFQIADTDTGELQTSPKWDAASMLNNRNLGYDPTDPKPLKPRTVVTYSADTNDGVAFNWASISQAMKDDLKTSPSGGVDSDDVGEDRLHYLRGDRTKEGTDFRQRLSRLGDMVNSGPVFVGPPGLSWPDFAPFPEGAEAYSTFKNGPAKDREPIVYIGANDAMLHGFSDDDGEEVFAYVPGLFSSTVAKDGLHYLTDGNYGHKFYVDLTPAISDVYISSGASPEWHTVLINGLRSGGRGLFALDITDPEQLKKESEAANIVLWEFSSDDDPDLGYTFSQPFIGLANDGNWVAVFGNGYNDLGSGEATLFIVDIEAGADGSWDLGDYRKISTGVGDPANPNGLSTPALADLDGNGTIDRVLAGDLRGNMWAFDLSSDNASQWNVAHRSGATKLPLFTTPANQPITAKPVLAKHPTQPDSQSPSNAPNLMVYFGTGQYLVDADKASTTQQSFYGVWDKGDDSLTRADLVEQTFDNTFSVRVLTRNSVDYSITWGWFFDLPIAGERAVTAPIARADTVFFNSFVPVEDPCSIGGFGFRFGVDMATGGSPLEASFDINNDGVIDDSDYVTNGNDIATQVAVRQEGFLPEPVFIEDLAFTAEEAIKVKALKNIPVGRFSWQELIQ